MSMREDIKFLALDVEAVGEIGPKTADAMRAR